MGKGRIVSGGTDGLYTVELLHDRERIDAEIASLTEKLAELQDELDALETERDGLVAKRNAIATDIDTAVANAEEGEIPDVEALLVELAQVSAQIQAQDVRIGMLKGRMLEATKRKEQLEAVPPDPQQQAWCADFTEDLTGEVATVEVSAEGIVGQFATWRRVQIRPGYEGRANYLPARDGQMHHRTGQVGYQAYFNAAILPGVQRWKPQYRIGTITAIDNETDICSLTIQGEDSSAQSLIIDPPDLQYAKSNVPIEYMDCNAEAFEVGDRVLVEFQGRDWAHPKVIGFETNPRECKVQVDYLAGTGLEITGTASQLIPNGGNTEPVEAVSTSARYDFLKWDDERTDNPRFDENVRESFSVTALAFSWPTFLVMQAENSGATQFISGGGPFSRSGSLETGRTTTWSPYNCETVENASFSATCNTILGVWGPRLGFNEIPDVVLHTTSNCSLSGNDITGTAYLLLPGFWKYLDTNIALSTIECGADAPSGAGPYQSVTGTEYEIESSDYDLFWSMIGTAPASVVLVHSETGATKTYYKAEIDGSAVNYRPHV